MKKLILLIFSLFIIQSSFAMNENSKNIELSNFKLKKFESCEDMSIVISDFMKKYYSEKKYKNYYDLKTFGETSLTTVISEKSTTDYSKTNTQVLGVDEADIIKTDGKYIYYVVDLYDHSINSKNKSIYIIENNNGIMNIIKKITLPNNFHEIELYVEKGKLVVIANSDNVKALTNFSAQDIYKNYVIVYDITDIKNPNIIKFHVLEGIYKQTRLIGDNLYVIGNKYFDYGYYSNNKNLRIKPNDIIPNEFNLTYTKDKNKQNFVFKGKKLPYEMSSGESVNCNEIEYLFPDEDTINKYDFNLSFNIISTINIKDVSKDVKNKIVFGDINEIHMSLDSLYLTSYFYTNYNFKCQFGLICPMAFYQRGENTLIHKFNIEDDASLAYKNSSIISGIPLNQYSMDEYNNNFRIITSSIYPERSTNLFILDDSLNLVSKLTGLAKGEDFKSSRFIGDKLFLVTFEQVDPLFVIDLKDVKNPVVLGELKIPGYSTYLHPYDENHLIGLGYDTKTNKWGGIGNSGIKLDLYQINYDKKCDDVNLTENENKLCNDGTYKGIIAKQLHTLTIGDIGSNSEALYNPRMFIWNNEKKLLFLPANIYGSYDKINDKSKDFYNGLFVLNIDKDKGIKQVYKTTHIDKSKLKEKIKKDCDRYILENKQSEQKCKGLNNSCIYNYIPEYCSEGYKIQDYPIQNDMYYVSYYIKRALYIGNNFYAISDKKITSNNIDTYADVGVVELK